MKRYYQTRRRKGLSSPEISLTPLIDTAWVLLVVFMIASPTIKKEAGLQVELPRGNMQETKPMTEKDITVVLDKVGTIFLNDSKVAEKDLIEKLKKLVGKGNEKTVFVKADSAAHYGKVIELVDKIKYVGGVTYVALATSKLS